MIICKINTLSGLLSQAIAARVQTRRFSRWQAREDRAARMSSGHPSPRIPRGVHSPSSGGRGTLNHKTKDRGKRNSSGNVYMISTLRKAPTALLELLKYMEKGKNSTLEMVPSTLLPKSSKSLPNLSKLLYISVSLFPSDLSSFRSSNSGDFS